MANSAISSRIKKVEKLCQLIARSIEPNQPSPIYKTKSTKLNLPSKFFEIQRTKFTNPNLFNKIYKTKSTKPILPNHIQWNQIKVKSNTGMSWSWASSAQACLIIGNSILTSACFITFVVLSFNPFARYLSTYTALWNL